MVNVRVHGDTAITTRGGGSRSLDTNRAFLCVFRMQEGVNTGVPSYGALSRRVDTQLLMATLTYVYYDAFILSGSKQSRASSFALVCAHGRDQPGGRGGYGTFCVTLCALCERELASRST